VTGHLVVTIDTEADDLWSRPRRYTCRNVRRVPRLHRLLERYGVRPTYLVSHEIVEDAEAVGILRDLKDGAEIGTHLHPFSTPPEYQVTGDDRYTQPYAFEYPLEITAKKLLHLTQAIEAALGRRPRSIRWGRWGFNASLVPLLEEHGYRVDTTVTPGVTWPGRSGRGGGGPSFASAGCAPYLLGRKDVCRPGPGPVLEVPVTITSRGGWAARLDRALGRARLGRLGRWLGTAPRWLRPFPWMTGAGLLDVCREASRAGCQVFNLMLHSSELLPGGSPYRKSEEDVARLFESLETWLAGMRREGIEPATLSELGALPSVAERSPP
jgi:peptidoglycan/xylan/chitin deacetylase (PgdA/CDA1 family)